jgi:hypothetical protein
VGNPHLPPDQVGTSAHSECSIEKHLKPPMAALALCIGIQELGVQTHSLYLGDT